MKHRHDECIYERSKDKVTEVGDKETMYTSMRMKNTEQFRTYTTSK